MKFLVAGAGGFIGGHLVKRLIDLGNKVVAVDNKKLENWYQIHNESENFELDLSLMPNCMKVTQNVNAYLI